jgi:hypothetical protein
MPKRKAHEKLCIEAVLGVRRSEMEGHGCCASILLVRLDDRAWHDDIGTHTFSRPTLLVGPLVLLATNSRKTQPKNQLHTKQRKNNRLQDLNTFSLCQCSDSKREDRSTRPTTGGCEAYSRYV